MNFDNYFQNYLVINAIFFLENNNLLLDILKNGYKKDENGKTNLYIDLLEYSGLLKNCNGIYIFEDSFKNDFLERGYGKMLVNFGYNDFFLNYSENNEGKKDNTKVALGTYIISKRDSEEYYSNYLIDNNVNSFLDVGSGNGNLLFFLANKFENKKFYGIEIDKESYNIAQNKLIKSGLTNLTFFNQNLAKISEIDIPNIEIVSGSFIFHELIELYDINKIISDIILKVKPNNFILREFTPPDNIFDKKYKDLDQFFISYGMFHFLSNQKTFSIDKWEEIFLNHGFSLNDLSHRVLYEDNNSMYPYLNFFKK